VLSDAMFDGKNRKKRISDDEIPSRGAHQTRARRRDAGWTPSATDGWMRASPERVARARAIVARCVESIRDDATRRPSRASASGRDGAAGDARRKHLSEAAFEGLID